jgi:hypothetical protein
MRAAIGSVPLGEVRGRGLIGQPPVLGQPSVCPKSGENRV